MNLIFKIKKRMNAIIKLIHINKKLMKLILIIQGIISSLKNYIK